MARGRKGRANIKGTRRKPAGDQRKPVTYAHKHKVLRFLDENTMLETIEEFYEHLPPQLVRAKKRQIYRWAEVRELIEQKCENGGGQQKNDRARGTGTVLSEEIEGQIVAWLNSFRTEGVPATALMLKMYALEVAKECGLDAALLRASDSWVRSLLYRHRLSIRKKTRAGQDSPEEADQVEEGFRSALQAIIEEEGVTEIYNADQTGVNYEYLPISTISPTGAKTVRTKCGGHTKDRVATMLFGCSDGRKLSPFLVIKQAPSKTPETRAFNASKQHDFGKQVWKEIRTLQGETEVLIYENASAWWMSDIMVALLDHFFGQRIEWDTRIVLLLNDFSGHWSENVTARADALGIRLVEVPPRFTCVCQPADIAWMKPLKNRLRARWLAHLREAIAVHKTQDEGSLFRLPVPTRRLLVSWLMRAGETSRLKRSPTASNGCVYASTLEPPSSMTMSRLRGPPTRLSSSWQLYGRTLARRQSTRVKRSLRREKPDAIYRVVPSVVLLWCLVVRVVHVAHGVSPVWRPFRFSLGEHDAHRV